MEWLELLTEAEVTLGHPELAADWAKHADEASAALPAGRQRGIALLAKAWAALPGSPADAAAIAAPAIMMLSDAGDQLTLARALLLAGRAHAAADNPTAAQDHLVRARAAAQRAGARGLVTEIDATRHRGAPAGGADRLTDRERTITELLLAGQTNREMAAALFLSTRTVEASLSKIYAKLGVRGRTRLIAHLTRDD